MRDRKPVEAWAIVGKRGNVDWMLNEDRARSHVSVWDKCCPKNAPHRAVLFREVVPEPAPGQVRFPWTCWPGVVAIEGPKGDISKGVVRDDFYNNGVVFDATRGGSDITQRGQDGCFCFPSGSWRPICEEDAS